MHRLFQKKTVYIGIIIELCILVALSVLCLCRERKVIAPSMDEWDAWMITYGEHETDEWYIDDSIYDGEAALDMIYGPYLEMEKGTYVVTVIYESDSENGCYIAADKGEDNSVYLRGDRVALDADSMVSEFRIEVTENIDNFEVRIQYLGTGYLKVDSIVIRETKTGDIRFIFCLFCAMVLLDLIVLFRDTIHRHSTEVAALLAILFLASLPELIADYYSGHDIYFHLLRIEGIAQELKNGTFPVKLHSIALYGYGQPVSVYYGDLFLYLPALLRLLGFSVVNSYKIYIFAVNAATVTMGYVCLKKIFHMADVALVGIMAYTLCTYRLINIYERAAVGEYTAMLAFPLIALAFYRSYISGTYGNWKEYRKNAFILAAGMTIVISSHILSTEMAVFMLFLVCAVCFKKTFRLNTLKVYGLAVVETLLFNAYFIVPFLDYYVNEDVNINHTVDEGTMKIQSLGAYIGQYFAFFQNPRGKASYSIFARMQMTPGPVLMGALVAGLYLLWKYGIKGSHGKRCLFYTVFSLLALFMASNIFPWDYLSERLTLFHLLAQVQFPWRYIGIAMIFLTLLLCELLCWFKDAGWCDWKRMCALLVGISVFMTSFLTSGLYDAVAQGAGLEVAGTLSNYGTASLDTGIVAGEYIRSGTDVWVLDRKFSVNGAKDFKIISRSGSRMVLYCENYDEDAYIEVPFLNYKGYHVRDEDGNEYAISDGENNVIGFTLPAYFKGEVTIAFEEPLYWRIAEIISLLSVIVVMVFYLKEYRRKG